MSETEMTEPQFPPLFTGLDAGGDDPFARACAEAQRGCDAGLVVYDLAPDVLRAAIVFAPDVALSQAVAMLAVCGIGLQNALGALAPPEVAVHLGWDGGVFVNGGRCGTLRIAAPDGPVDEEPDWLVVDLSVTLWPASDDTGLTPDQTALYAEGCAEIDAVSLLEAWVRHTLVGINTWSDGGQAALHRDWQGLAHEPDGTLTVAGHTGTRVGLDENLGLLLKTGADTVLIPLTDILTAPK